MQISINCNLFNLKKINFDTSSDENVIPEKYKCIISYNYSFKFKNSCYNEYISNCLNVHM